MEGKSFALARLLSYTEARRYRIGGAFHPKRGGGHEQARQQYAGPRPPGEYARCRVRVPCRRTRPRRNQAARIDRLHRLACSLFWRTYTPYYRTTPRTFRGSTGVADGATRSRLVRA